MLFCVLALSCFVLVNGTHRHILFLIKGQTFLTPSVSFSDSLVANSSSCFAIYSPIGSTVVAEVTSYSTKSFIIGASSSCGGVYTYKIGTGNGAYILSFGALYAGYQYIMVQNTNNISLTYTIVASNKSAVHDGALISLNKTYYGSINSNYYGVLKYCFYMPTDYFDVYVQGAQTYFELKRSETSTYAERWFTGYYNDLDKGSINCTSKSSGSGTWCLKLYSSVNQTVSTKIVTQPSPPRQVSVSEGERTISLAPGYNYYKIFVDVWRNLKITLTSSDSWAVGIVSSSSSNCLITKFDSTLTMSPSNPIWVYYPPSSGYKTISIYNPQPTNATIKLNLKTNPGHLTEPIPLVRYVNYVIDWRAFDGADMWVFFTYNLTNSYPFTLKNANGGDLPVVYVRQSSQPNTATYDWVWQNPRTITLDPCRNVFFVYTPGNILYFGVYYNWKAAGRFTLTSDISYQSSCVTSTSSSITTSTSTTAKLTTSTSTTAKLTTSTSTTAKLTTSSSTTSSSIATTSSSTTGTTLSSSTSTTSSIATSTLGTSLATGASTSSSAFDTSSSTLSSTSSSIGTTSSSTTTSSSASAATLSSSSTSSTTSTLSTTASNSNLTTISSMSTSTTEATTAISTVDSATVIFYFTTPARMDESVFTSKMAEILDIPQDDIFVQSFAIYLSTKRASTYQVSVIFEIRNNGKKNAALLMVRVMYNDPALAEAGFNNPTMTIDGQTSTTGSGDGGAVSSSSKLQYCFCLIFLIALL